MDRVVLAVGMANSLVGVLVVGMANRFAVVLEVGMANSTRAGHEE